MKCTKCKGDGFTAEHQPPAFHPEECTNCPVQVECGECSGTGEVAQARLEEIKSKLGIK